MIGDNYMWVGQSAVEAIIASVGSSLLTAVNTVLDFPCGHGRVLRHLVELFPDARFDAGDLDQEGAHFCAKRFGAEVVLPKSDLTETTFPRKYDLIWIGSLFTHVSEDRSARWLAFLADQLTDKGIIVATFHGRWSMRMQKLVPFTDAKRWDQVIEGYETGYGFADYRPGLGHDLVPGSYGVSAVRPHHLIKMVELHSQRPHFPLPGKGLGRESGRARVRQARLEQLARELAYLERDGRLSGTRTEGIVVHEARPLMRVTRTRRTGINFAGSELSNSGLKI